MKTIAGRHWIAGVWRSDPGSAVFDLRQRVPPHESVGSWPRGDGGLARAAVEASGRALGEWRGAGPPERSAVLLRAVENVLADGGWKLHLERYLGLREHEVADEAIALERLHERFAERGDRTLSDPGVTVVFARWTDLVGGLATRVLCELFAGRGVLVLSDERWPLAGDVLAGALAAAGLPAGLVSVLHGSQEACLDVLSGAAVDDVSFRIDRGEVERANRSYVVEQCADLRRAAVDVVAKSFGRRETLSGQKPGRIGRVLCHRAVFSSFTDALLAELADHPDVKDPVPVIDGRALVDLRGLWELGVDEGATLVFGGELLGGEDSARPRERRVWPTVFTNVEVEMGLCHHPDPAPVLCLLRAQSDAAAQELARTIG